MVMVLIYGIFFLCELFIKGVEFILIWVCKSKMVVVSYLLGVFVVIFGSIFVLIV